MKKKYAIYSLSCPIDNRVRYVGLTNNLKEAYRQHLNGEDYRTREWILNLGFLLLSPNTEIVYRFYTRKLAILQKDYLIKEFKSDLNTIIN